MTIDVDRTSLLASVPGEATLDEIERALEREGLTLGVPTSAEPIARWIARGAPSAPSGFSDPADHLLAGMTVTLTSGRRLVVHPSPRRAVGPDLMALFVGGKERFGTIEHAWVRVHPRDARRVSNPLMDVDLDPPISDDETSLLDAIGEALSIPAR